MVRLNKNKKIAVSSSFAVIIAVAAVFASVHAATTSAALSTAHNPSTQAAIAGGQAALSANVEKSGARSAGTISKKPGSGSQVATSSGTSVASSGSATGSSTKSAATGSATNQSSGGKTSVLPTLNYPSTLYTDPTGDVATSADAWAESNQSDAARMHRLAAVPMAEWYVGDNSNVTAAANSYVSAAAAANQVPVLVAYNIPDRDCGSYSAGGAATDADYISWVSALAAGIGNRPAIVIVEPDALADLSCLSSAQQTSRLADIASAVRILKSETASKVYIDAGNPGWIAAVSMAADLKNANIAAANGFSLNVSNFYTTASNISYGTTLSSLVGGKHFVIDTSRNGNGPTSDDQWCNPAGMAVGALPTLQTDNSLVDAYVWVKGVGGSDGSCGPDEGGTMPPAAGVWWPQYADAILSNSGW